MLLEVTGIVENNSVQGLQGMTLLYGHFFSVVNLDIVNLWI